MQCCNSELTFCCDALRLLTQQLVWFSPVRSRAREYMMSETVYEGRYSRSLVGYESVMLCSHVPLSAQ